MNIYQSSFVNPRRFADMTESIKNQWLTITHHEEEVKISLYTVYSPFFKHIYVCIFFITIKKSQVV